MRSVKYIWLYRRICSPDNKTWAELLKKHNYFYQMGDNCSIQSNAVFTDPKHVRLGNNVNISDCRLFGHDGSVNMLKKMTGFSLDKVGKIDIRDNVYIGHGAIIMPGVTIGPCAIVASGAVVTRDVSQNSIVGGIPARQIGKVDEYLQKCLENTKTLPWFGRPEIAADFFGPASAELTRMRCAYFFEQPAESQESHDDRNA